MLLEKFPLVITNSHFFAQLVAVFSYESETKINYFFDQI